MRRKILVGTCLLELEGLRRRVQVRPFLVGRILVHVRSVVSRANGYRDTTQNSVRIYLNDDIRLKLFCIHATYRIQNVHSKHSERHFVVTFVLQHVFFNLSQSF